jgi:hypothetical protein
MFRSTPHSSLFSIALVLLLVLAVSAQFVPWLHTASAESGPVGITGEGGDVPEDAPADDPPTTEGDPDEPEHGDLKQVINVTIISWLILILNS